MAPKALDNLDRKPNNNKLEAAYWIAKHECK